MLWIFLLFAPGILTGCGQGAAGASAGISRSSVTQPVARTPKLTWHSPANPAPTQLPAGEVTGTLVVSVQQQTAALAVRDLPANTSSVEIVVAGTQLAEPFSLVLGANQLSNGQAIFSVSNLLPGLYEFSVAARDAAGMTLATGRTTLTVSQGSLVPVHLVLEAPPAGGSGALAILIDTPVTDTPTTSYPTGDVAATVH